MKKTYYLFNDGRVSRKDNTLCFIARDKEGNEQPPKYLPIETIEQLYAFGSLDVNATLLNYLGQRHIPIHFFDYYEHYTGSFMPKDYLLAGKMQIAQTKCYLTLKKRKYISQCLLEGASHNMIKNLKYYANRGRDIQEEIKEIENLVATMPNAKDIPSIMGIEGNIRKKYYDCFDAIITDFEMNGREKQPPSNEVNALVSFGNMVCYTLALDMIYHTQLNPTISFLHEPGYRRYSLALDIAEVFKPILVDRTIFRVLNKREIQAKHFISEANGCFLKPEGKKIFLQAWEERLTETIKHRKLNKNVSYKHLVKLECYKIAKYVLGDQDTYDSFKIWW